MSASPNFEELLQRDGFLAYKTRGVSMRPLFRENRDLVTVRPVTGALHKYDVPLYRRQKDGGYVLHRIIGETDTAYIIRGDNTFFKEIVPKDHVVGVLTAFKRKKKDHTVDETGYRVYARVWNFIYPVRLVLHKTRRLGGRVKRALKGETVS